MKFNQHALKPIINSLHTTTSKKHNPWPPVCIAAVNRTWSFKLQIVLTPEWCPGQWPNKSVMISFSIEYKKCDFLNFYISIFVSVVAHEIVIKLIESKIDIVTGKLCWHLNGFQGSDQIKVWSLYFSIEYKSVIFWFFLFQWSFMKLS